MQAKMLYTLLLHDSVALHNLLIRQAILCFHRVSDDCISCSVLSRVVTKTDGLRNLSNSFLKCLNMGDVIKIDDGSKLIGCEELLFRGIIAGEHDSLSTDTTCLAEQQLRKGGTVSPEPFLGKKLEN